VPAIIHKLLRLGLNLGLRGGSLLAKFGLMIYITRYIGLEAVGVFGLLQAANVIGTKVVGYGLYFVANRDMVDIAPTQQARIIRDQQVVYGLGYLAVGALTLALWPWVPETYRVYTLYSVALLISGHQVLELGNILIALHRPLACNVLFAITNGLWALPPILMGLLDPAWRTLDCVLLGWLIGALASWVLAIAFLRPLPFAAVLRTPPNWVWIKTALWRGMPLFVAILTMNGSLYVDRYLVSWLTTLELAGVFVMFWSFAYAVQILVQTGVLVNEYPKLIADYKQRDEAQFWQRFRALSWRMAWAGGGFCLIAAVAITPIIHFLNKPLALEHMNLFYMMLLAFWIRFQADVSNYALYARHQDKALSFSYVMNLVIASASNGVFVWLWGLEGAAVAQLVTAIALTGLQGWLLWQKRHAHPPSDPQALSVNDTRD
jgi:O-antigen/teichoic acid export membrane protein